MIECESHNLVLLLLGLPGLDVVDPSRQPALCVLPHQNKFPGTGYFPCAAIFADPALVADISSGIDLGYEVAEIKLPAPPDVFLFLNYIRLLDIDDLPVRTLLLGDMREYCCDFVLLVKPFLLLHELRQKPVRILLPVLWER